MVGPSLQPLDLGAGSHRRRDDCHSRWAELPATLRKHIEGNCRGSQIENTCQPLSGLCRSDIAGHLQRAKACCRRIGTLAQSPGPNKGTGPSNTVAILQTSLWPKSETLPVKQTSLSTGELPELRKKCYGLFGRFGLLSVGMCGSLKLKDHMLNQS